MDVAIVSLTAVLVALAALGFVVPRRSSPDVSTAEASSENPMTAAMIASPPVREEPVLLYVVDHLTAEGEWCEVGGFPDFVLAMEVAFTLDTARVRVIDLRAGAELGVVAARAA
jgi:hypothetical protein